VVVRVKQLKAQGAEQTGDLVTARVTVGNASGSRAALGRRVLEVDFWRAMPADGGAGASRGDRSQPEKLRACGVGGGR
jgi:hypothetical protein